MKTIPKHSMKKRVAIINVDSKMPNLALMKLSAWHKKQGDAVELYVPLFQYDVAYASKVFDDTPDMAGYWPECEIIKGGTGYDIKTEMAPEIECMRPDYELFRVPYAMGFTTRGCIRNCEFCVVPEKEGTIRPVADIYDFWNGQKELMLLDNNLTAEPEHFKRILHQLITERIFTSFSQGLDIRLIDDEKAALLKQVRLWRKKRIHFAFDFVAMEPAVRKGIFELTHAGINPDDLTFYVLIGFNTTPDEDLYRVELLRSLKVSPFVMPFNRRDPYQRRFARWVNHKATFHTCKWHEYTG